MLLSTDWGFVLMWSNKVNSYAFRQLKNYEENYVTDDLEWGMLVFALEI